MKSMWPGRLNIGLQTHSMVYQQLDVATSTSYGCKTFFFFLDQSEINRPEKKSDERGSPIAKWTHYVGGCLGSYRAKKTTKAK